MQKYLKGVGKIDLHVQMSFQYTLVCTGNDIWENDLFDEKLIIILKKFIKQVILLYINVKWMAHSHSEIQVITK